MNIGRWLLLTGALLTFLIALTVAGMVIPPLETDPMATPGSAVTSFWLNVLVNALLGIVLIAMLFLSGELLRKSLLWLIGLGPLLLGLFLLDGASAFSRHGQEMQGVSSILLWCAAGDILAGLLVITGARFRTRGKKK